MSNQTFPPVDEQVLKALESRFPDKLPSPGISEHRLHELIGQQEVIRFLRFTFEEQTSPRTDTTEE